MICMNGLVGSHNMEFVASMDGGSYWKCLNPECGEIMFQYEDCNGG